MIARGCKLLFRKESNTKKKFLKGGYRRGSKCSNSEDDWWFLINSLDNLKSTNSVRSPIFRQSSSTIEIRTQPRISSNPPSLPPSPSKFKDRRPLRDVEEQLLKLRGRGRERRTTTRILFIGGSRAEIGRRSLMEPGCVISQRPYAARYYRGGGGGFR